MSRQLTSRFIELWKTVHPYLRHVLAFIGLTDVAVIHAEHQPNGPRTESSRRAALEPIGELMKYMTIASPSN